MLLVYAYDETDDRVTVLTIQDFRSSRAPTTQRGRSGPDADGVRASSRQVQNGEGSVVSGEVPDVKDQRQAETLESSDLLAVSTLGQLARNPRVSALRRFITGWYLSYLSADSTRGTPEAGPQARLSRSGDNLANVIQHLREQHPDRLAEILRVLAERVPRLERVNAEMLADGRLMLQLTDAPFEDPILAKFASDGTLKLLAYLTVLYDPQPGPLVGIEEPENQLHPRLLPLLAEECRTASGRGQLLVTTHSPYFVNGLRPQELWGPRPRPGRLHPRAARERAPTHRIVRAGGCCPRRPLDGGLLRGGGPASLRAGRQVGVHLEILLEEPSAEAVLETLLPRLVGSEVGFSLRAFNGKADLMRKLEQRLRAYTGWIESAETRVVVLIDEDRQDCRELKTRLEEAAAAAGLSTKTAPRPDGKFLCSTASRSRSSKPGSSGTATRCARPTPAHGAGQEPLAELRSLRVRCPRPDRRPCGCVMRARGRAPRARSRGPCSPGP